MPCARGELEPAHHTAIFRESGGNPFYALALAGAARTPAHSVSSDRLATDSGVPRPVAAALLEEFDALTPTPAGCWTRARSPATRSSRNSRSRSPS